MLKEMKQIKSLVRDRLLNLCSVSGAEYMALLRIAAKFKCSINSKAEYVEIVSLESNWKVRIYITREFDKVTNLKFEGIINL